MLQREGEREQVRWSGSIGEKAGKSSGSSGGGGQASRLVQEQANWTIILLQRQSEDARGRPSKTIQLLLLTRL